MQEQDEQERQSKSARKREVVALQELAERMAALSDRELERLGVAAALREALAQVRPMRPSGARNRQLKHCVKFMGGDALGEVEAYLQDRHSQQVSANRTLHAVERWRDRLVSEGDAALDQLIEALPDLDRQQMRQLMRDAARERETGKPAGAGRKLFRHLRSVIEADDPQKIQ